MISDTLYTQKAVQTLCVSNGWTTTNAKTAAAIAMAETLTFKSGVQYCDFDKIGDQALVNDTWGFSYGAFQIRSRKAELGKNTARDANRLPEPAFNCRAALVVFNIQGFKAWSTYNSEAYKGFLKEDFPTPLGTYRVSGGDSLSWIASKTFCNWHDLAKVNRLTDPYLIFPGQVLLLPEFPHTVVSGETLSGIAFAYGSNLTYSRLMAYNHLTSTTIRIGQVLKIPRL